MSVTSLGEKHDRAVSGSFIARASEPLLGNRAPREEGCCPSVTKAFRSLTSCFCCLRKTYPVQDEALTSSLASPRKSIEVAKRLLEAADAANTQPHHN